MPTHAYHRTLTTKIFCARKSAPESPLTTFAQALQIIRGLHAATAGVPQVVYLAGWQHDGHDSKYPDWSVVNPRLAPGEDAAEALRRLMREARAYNATVSLHINMDDAYPNSPLWDAYVRADVLLRGVDGAVAKGDVWDGELCHWICKSREWASGLARQRIDALCALLPIREAGTVHIDAFRPNPSPGHRTDWATEVAACRSIVGYWNGLGIDVTTEYLADPELVDLHPMVYHDNRDERHRLEIPPDVLCGGGSGWNCRQRTVRHGTPGWWGGFCTPGAGCVHPEAWGNSIDHDLAWSGGDRGPLDVAAADRLFHRDSLPWLRLNRSRPSRFEHSRTVYAVDFEDGVRSAVDLASGRHRILDGDRLILDGPDRCIEAAWTGGGSIAWHGQGGRRRWDLGLAWRGIGRAEVSVLDPAGRRAGSSVAVRGGAVELDLEPARAVLLSPG